MPKYLEATVIRPVVAQANRGCAQDAYDLMKEELSRWTIGETWWGEKGIDGPAALLKIDSSTDMLAQLFAITEMGYAITRVHLRFERTAE